MIMSIITSKIMRKLKRKDLIKEAEEPEVIYLTEHELMKLYNLGPDKLEEEIKKCKRRFRISVLYGSQVFRY